MTPQIESAPYTPNDYQAVLLINAAPTVLCTKPDFPAATGQELLATIKANPGHYTYGTDGVGGFMQLAVERILSRVGAKARSVPFASAGETLLAMLGGHIDIYSGAVTIVQPYVKNGQAKCLLLTSAKRVDSLPGAASLTDVGLADAETLVWHGLIGPNGIPPDRMTVLQAAFDKAAHSERYVKYAESRGIDIDVRNAVDFRKLIDNEYSAMVDVIKGVGLSKK
jgi:tripartite-type tricarboxylate transporter receptor subunit TctC